MRRYVMLFLSSLMRRLHSARSNFEVTKIEFVNWLLTMADCTVRHSTGLCDLGTLR